MIMWGLSVASAFFCMQVGCEVGVNKLKELTRVTSQSAALTAASDAARAGDFASARPTWEFVADRKLADCTMLQRFIPQDPCAPPPPPTTHK